MENGKAGNFYIHGPGIDEPLALIDNNNKAYYYHADGLGSIVVLTDEKGKAVQEYEYDSFGNMKDRKNKVKQPYAFTGREWDREAKLYYYRARYYDAGAGRFISFDPILRGVSGFNETSCRQSVAEIAGKMPKEMNPFSYTENNPVNYVDPFGLHRYSWCGGDDKFLCKCLTDIICDIAPPEHCCKSDYIDCMKEAGIDENKQGQCAFQYAICLSSL